MIHDLPTTGIGLVSLTIATIGGIITLRIQQKMTNSKINDMHEQVVNDHPATGPNATNLRDDIDLIQTIVSTMARDLTGIRIDISSVRSDLHSEVERSVRVDGQIMSELADERERSIIVDRDLRRLIDEKYPDREP